MKKVLITGGMGFIGRALTKKLLEETDYKIVIVDNLSSCSPDKILLENKRIRFDDADFSLWKPPKGEKYDYIYHLAGPVGPVRVLDFSGQMARIIINQLHKAADLALAMEAKLIFISSSEVYGTHAKREMSEQVNPVVPSEITVRLEYGLAKLMGEVILKNISRVSPLKYACVRPFNIIGSGQNDKGGFVIPRFVRKALNGEPITVYGDGSMVRTFTHIDDFINAIMMLMESEVTGEVFNVGNPKNTLTILELAEHIVSALESKSEIQLVDPKELFGDTFEEAWDKIPNISKLRKAVGWEPLWDIDKIMEELARSKQHYLVD